MSQMNPSSQRPSIGLSSHRNSITWFFILILLIYSLYSSKLILNKDDNPNCSLASSSDISDKQKLEQVVLTIPPPSTTTTNSSQEEPTENAVVADPSHDNRDELQLNDIIFGIAASSKLWEKRKEYIKLWWRPGETRGVVWLDKPVVSTRDEGLPDIRISGNTSDFKYTNRQGKRSALRISRVVSETLRLGMKDVKWFVMGDDDTVFIVENVVRVLSKYDHNQYYYVGSSSESHIQNLFFSYSMAYGGGGFAISYPLAKELEKMQDRCIQRYPGLYGSDDRIQACMAELGVPLTKEIGFHQYDVYGNLLGLLGAHPVTPLVSLHHLDVVDPIFPGMKRVEGLRRLFESVEQDSASIIQQSICYDTKRPVSKHPCQKPFLFYLKSVKYDEKRRQIIGVYSRYKESYPYCRWKSDSPEKLDSIVVLKKPDSSRWKRSPRRDCCRVLPSRKESVLYLWVGNCRQGEISEL
ncbi:hypothetical protein BUALT_Bualt13G0082800 [Buddleja alternifolia]|uniref:Uncharacterized protein n=1 Tax=Buddleja alternifolia TaxID=168488 RepID=A0AAV6WR82_9LAMI|nr:hypothetical protein BUALT_Bualt13G0082800 [Buddleja alternifolia]